MFIYNLFKYIIDLISQQNKGEHLVKPRGINEGNNFLHQKNTIYFIFGFKKSNNIHNTRM